MSARDDIALIDKLNWDDVKVVDNKIVIMPKRTEPYMFNTKQDVFQYNIGDTVDISFQDHPKALKKYRGKKLTFILNNVFDYKFGGPMRTMAFVPVDKKDDFKKTDVLFVAPYHRFECLMIDLFACNRRPFAGWKQKTVTMRNN